MNTDSKNSSIKRALVTGASGMIGSAIARRLAADGLFVYLHAHRGIESAKNLEKDIIHQGGQAKCVVFDVTQADDTHTALEEILSEGTIQVLVNNAGKYNDGAFPGMRAEQWQEVMDINVNGFYNVTQPLLLPMIRTRWGRIVNISSLSGIVGNQGQVNYSAAKGAINAATMALALEVAKRGITVNAVAPGIITREGSDEPFGAETIKRLVPMQRAGRADEVADLVGFLCSEQASYITRQVISINGGVI